MFDAEGKPVRQAYATLLTSASYFPGLIALHHSLQAVQSRHPLIVIHNPSLERYVIDLLDEWKIPRICVQDLRSTGGKDYTNDPRFKDVMTKLTVFSLTSFDTLVLLDNDMLVRHNMDELMDVELDSPDLGGQGDRVFASTHACVCNPLKKPHYPSDWRPENCAYSAQHDDPETAQATAMPSSYGLSLLNSGILVVKPSTATYDLIRREVSNPDLPDYNFPDQDLLANLFHSRWAALPYVYNALRTLKESEIHLPIWKDHEVRNVHYILSPKPWDAEVPKTTLTQWWLDNFAQVDSKYKVRLASHLR